MANHPDQPLPPVPSIDSVFAKANWLKIEKNNFQLDMDQLMCKTNSLFLHIIQGHPLWPVFNNITSVPEVYLQQFWNTLHIEGNHLRASIGAASVRVSKNRIRNVLALPQQNHYPDRVDFDDFVSDTQLLQEIHDLGYERPLAKLSQFRRMYLCQPWQTLLLIINKCLTGKHSGFDTATRNTLRILHGVAYNHHYDYAQCIWEDIIDYVGKKGTKLEATAIPYVRFFCMIVKFFMRTNSDIRKRRSKEYITPSTLLEIKRDRQVLTAPAMLVPQVLLNMADQDVQEIIAYRDENNILAPMEQPNPAEPAQGAELVGEGLEDEGDEEEEGEGEAEGDESEENENEGEGVEGENDDDDVGDKNGGDGDDDDGNEHRSKKFFDHDSSRAINERERAEKEKAELERIEKERTEKESVENEKNGEQSSESDDMLGFSEGVSSPIQESRAQPSRSGTTPCSTAIEVIASPAVHAQASPSHLSVSQLMDISTSHGDIAHNLSPPHSEVGDVDTSGPLPQSIAPLFCTMSLEPTSPNVFLFFRPHTAIESSAGLSDLTGTPAVTPTTGASRGSGVSTTKATIEPTLNVGYMIDSTAVITERLGGTGVTRSTDKGKAIAVEPFKLKYKRKSPPREKVIYLQPATHFTRQDPIVAARNLSLEDLKAVFMEKLMTEHPEVEQPDIQSLVNIHYGSTTPPPPNPQPQPTQQQLQAIDTKLSTLGQLVHESFKVTANSLLTLSKEVQQLRQSCRSQAEASKRKHDDCDDPDHHEGEKRQNPVDRRNGT